MATTPDKAWIEAEKAITSKLLKATGATKGKNFFLEDTPLGDTNVWGLMTGGGSAEDTWDTCWDPLDFNAQIFGLFQKRESAQILCGKIIRLLSETNNLAGSGNVEWFRALDFPQLSLDSVVLKGDKKASWHTRLTWNFQVEFHIKEH